MARDVVDGRGGMNDDQVSDEIQQEHNEKEYLELCDDLERDGENLSRLDDEVRDDRDQIHDDELPAALDDDQVTINDEDRVEFDDD